MNTGKGALHFQGIWEGFVEEDSIVWTWIIRTDCYLTEKGRNITCKEKRRAGSSCLAGAVRCEGARQSVCESVAQRNEVFGLHLKRMGSNQRQMTKVILLMAMRKMNWKVEAARSDRVWKQGRKWREQRQELLRKDNRWLLRAYWCEAARNEESGMNANTDSGLATW